ncbi:MAG TPA: alpha/beta hydrolase [bacterium]|jgi:pimeloyl-ACP methyl ester carboxylesterase
MSLEQLPWYERANLDIQEFSAAGVRTFAVVEGKPDSFPVIFLHGLPGGAFIWTSVIKALGRSRLAIAPDLPGWGKSFSRFAKAPPDLSAEGMQRWLKGLLAAQSIQRFDLVAHGDSSWPALDLLLTDPARVRRLSLISAPLWESPARGGVRSKLFGKAKWSPKTISRWVQQNAALSESAKTESQLQFAQLLGTEQGTRTSPTLAEAGTADRIRRYRAALKEYQGAKLLIWGRNDPRAAEKNIAELQAEVEDADIQRIDNAGHFPMLDAPDEVATLEKEFLGE